MAWQGAGNLNMLIDAIALPLWTPNPPLVANTALYESHNLSGNVTGLMTALKQMLSAKDTVSLPGSLHHVQSAEKSQPFPRNLPLLCHSTNRQGDSRRGEVVFRSLGWGCLTRL